LGKYFSVSPQFWLNLQSRYALEVESDELVNVLKHKVKTFQFVS